MTDRPAAHGNAEASRKRWIVAFWGSLPALFLFSLLAVIAVLFFKIRVESEELKTQQAENLRKDTAEVNVITMEVRPMPIRDRINLPGQTAPWVRLEVMAEVRGKVVEKVVSEGRQVRFGDVLAVVDKRDYQIAHAAARASYEVARADLNRIEELYAEQLATRSRLDNTRANAETLKAAMEGAALSLERCTIVAPIAGIVNRVDIEQGQYLNVGEPVAEILQLQPAKVVVGIPESDVDAVRGIDRFTMRIDALGGETFSGSKHFLSRTADSDARIYNLEIRVDNPDGKILPDMFTRVDIVKRSDAEGLSVPLYAVISREGEQSVFVENGGRAFRKRVSLGFHEGWRVQITDGLVSGEQVVVVGHRELNDNQPVRVVRRVLDPEEIHR